MLFPPVPVVPFAGLVAPYDETAKAAIEAAVAAAGENPTSVDTGHELLGILEVGDGVAAKALAHLGVDPAGLADAVRASTTSEI